MRVLLVTIGYLPTLSSTARLYSELASDIRDAGHTVSVLAPVPNRYLAEGTTKETDRWLHEEEIDGVPVLRVRKLPVPQHVPMARVAERFALGIGCRVAGRRLPRQDVVISYSPPLSMARAAERMAERWDAPVVVNVQDLYPQTVIDLDLLTNPVLRRGAEWLESRVYRGATTITVHSSGNKRFLVEEKGVEESTVEVVPNWVDLDETSPGPRDNAWRDRHGIDDDTFVVSFAGAMGFAQGLEDILHVADALRGRQNLLFLMVGEGTFLEDLQQIARDLELHNVRFLPSQPFEDYDAMLRASDVSLVPLNPKLATPVVPGKLQSIMAAGRPVIQYSHPASDGRRIIEDAGCGLFVEAGNPDRLAAAIEQLHDDPDLGRAMGRRGRSYSESHFDRNSCTGRYLDLIERIT